MRYLIILFLLLLPLAACNKDDAGYQPDDSMYFPSDNEWETITLSSLGWNEIAVQPLKDFLAQKNTRSFMIIVNGRIVMEEYFNGILQPLPGSGTAPENTGCNHNTYRPAGRPAGYKQQSIRLSGRRVDN